MGFLAYWLVFFAYIIFLVFVGLNSYRKQKAASNAEEENNDYWITGRSQPAYMVGMSIASGWMLIGMITWMTWATYDQGVGGLWVVVIPWILCILSQIGLARPLRKISAISQCQMLQKRFGLPARIFTAPINIFSYTIWSCLELYAASMILAPALGISIQLMIVIYAIPIAFYMALGGFRSVISANTIQFFMGMIILAVTSIAICMTAHNIAVAHHSTIWAMLDSQKIINSAAYPVNPAKHATNLFSYVSMSFPLIVIISLVPGWAGEEDFWLKAQAAKSTHDARLGGVFSLVFNTLIICIPASIIGLMGIIVFKPQMINGVLSAASVLGAKGGYNVISVYINNYMPPLLKGLLIFLLSAHTMSTVANYSNVTSMNLSYDILQPLVYRKLKWSDEKIVKWSRLVTIFIIALNVLMAELMNNPVFGASLNAAYFLSSGLLSCGISVMLFAMFWKRANLTGVMTGGICGTLGTIIFFILEYKVWKFSYTMPVWDWIFGKGAMASSLLGYCVIGMVCALVGLVVGTLLGPKSTPEQLAAISENPIDNNEQFFKDLKECS